MIRFKFLVRIKSRGLIFFMNKCEEQVVAFLRVLKAFEKVGGA